MKQSAVTVKVPIASFRVPHAREYFETLPCPPPSTVYGMLLSMIGEEDRWLHEGAELAIALLNRPDLSTVLRTLWRVKDKNTPMGIKPNARPDFQELLSPINLAVYIRPGKDEAEPPLCQRIVQALRFPSSVERHGALSLGESTHMVNDVLLRNPDDQGEGRMLVHDPDGPLCLPIWVDHVGTEKTQTENYRLEQTELQFSFEKNVWTRIRS